jgi:hypothetical protein
VGMPASRPIPQPAPSKERRWPPRPSPPRGSALLWGLPAVLRAASPARRRVRPRPLRLQGLSRTPCPAQFPA